MVESNTIETQNIRNEVTKQSNNAKRFVDIHIKLFEKLEAGTKKSVAELVQNECINTIRINNMLIQNPQQSEGGVVTFKPRTNYFIVVKEKRCTVSNVTKYLLKLRKPSKRC